MHGREHAYVLHRAHSSSAGCPLHTLSLSIASAPRREREPLLRWISLRMTRRLRKPLR